MKQVLPFSYWHVILVQLPEFLQLESRDQAHGDKINPQRILAGFQVISPTAE